jgi:hypothetical protein
MRLILPACCAIIFSYFVLLKRPKVGTLGYSVGGVRIVGMDCQRPGLLALTVRMLFMIFGPFNYLVDLAWMSGDQHRQDFRDKLADTYVVRRLAEPIGAGRVIHRYYLIVGYDFLFREIEV